MVERADAEIEACLRGEKLYGDDFDAAAIAAWHADERDAYAELSGAGAYRYAYHAINRWHGFDRLPARRFGRVLGLGSAYGDEFGPIADRIDELTILDPSDQFARGSALGIPTEYRKPTADGALPFGDASFDLVTSFGVLHHIPNVSRVMSEIARCLKPGGYALIREPIVSLGDWREKRRGLTRRERGIPLPLYREIRSAAGLLAVRESLCFFPITPRLWKAFARPAYNDRIAVAIDAALSALFRWNLRYHRATPWQKLCPTCVFSVLTRPL